MSMPELDPSTGIWGAMALVGSSVATFFAGQRNGKAQFINAVTKASETVIERLTKECDRMESARIACEAGREECQAELSTMRQQIWDLMRAEAPATYQPSDLKRVGKEDL